MEYKNININNRIHCFFRNKASEEYIRLEGIANEIKQERDMFQRTVEDLKLQLSLCEDKSESVSGQLQDTLRKLKEGMILS